MGILRHAGASGAAMALASLALIGCSTVRGRPAATVDIDSEVATLASLHDAGQIVACLKLPLAGEQDCRNSIVQARMIAIDARYTQFRQSFYGQARWGSFGATVLTLGLTAGASLSPLAAAHVLGAAAAGVTGTQAAYDKQVLVDRTANALESSMDSGRAMVSVRIRQGLQRPASDYTLASALSDLEDYYNAGTVLGGLIDISNNAGTQAQIADQQLRSVSGFTQGSAADFLRGYINPVGATDAIRNQRLADVDAAERKIAMPYQLPSLLATSGTPAQIEPVARLLGWSSP